MISYKRFFLFIIGCMSMRLLISYLAFKLPGIWRDILAVILGIMGIGFLTIYFGGYRKTGLETGGNKIWWNNLRPLHGILYLISSGLLLFKGKALIKTIPNNHLASYIILTDTLIGLIAWINNTIKSI